MQQPSQTQDSPYSLAGSGAKLGEGRNTVRLGTGDDGSSIDGYGLPIGGSSPDPRLNGALSSNTASGLFASWYRKPATDDGSFDIAERRRLSNYPGPSLLGRAANFVTDTLSGAWTAEKTWLKSWSNLAVPGSFPEESRTPLELMSDMRTAGKRIVLDTAQGLLQASALAGATSPEAIVGGGLFPRVEQVRQETLAEIPSISFEKPMYSDGAYNGFGRSMENVFSFGLDAWGAYGVVKGGISLTSALRFDANYGFRTTSRLSDNLLAEADFANPAVTGKAEWQFTSLSKAETVATRTLEGPPIPRIDVSDRFTITPYDGVMDVDYLNAATDGHGLNAYINRNGLLSFEIKAKGDTSTLGSGTDMFASMMMRLDREGIKVNGITGTWVSGTDSVNAADFAKNLATGMSPTDAALNTWTGKIASRYGYTDVTVPKPMGDVQFAYFKKPPQQ